MLEMRNWHVQRAAAHCAPVRRVPEARAEASSRHRQSHWTGDSANPWPFRVQVELHALAHPRPRLRLRAVELPKLASRDAIAHLALEGEWHPSWDESFAKFASQRSTRDPQEVSCLGAVVLCTNECLLNMIGLSTCQSREFPKRAALELDSSRAQFFETSAWRSLCCTDQAGGQLRIHDAVGALALRRSNGRKPTLQHVTQLSHVSRPVMTLYAFEQLLGRA